MFKRVWGKPTCHTLKNCVFNLVVVHLCCGLHSYVHRGSIVCVCRCHSSRSSRCKSRDPICPCFQRALIRARPISFCILTSTMSSVKDVAIATTACGESETTRVATPPPQYPYSESEISLRLEPPSSSMQVSAADTERWAYFSPKFSS